MYVAGTDHRNKEPARRFLARVQDGEIEGCTSTEVLQEILYRYTALDRRDLAREVYGLFVQLCPVIFDVTHALQIPGGRSDSAGGRRQAVSELMLAGMSQGIGGLFLVSHPDPSQAMCDGPCALPLDKLEPFLAQAKAMDDLVKGLPAIDVA